MASDIQRRKARRSWGQTDTTNLDTGPEGHRGQMGTKTSKGTGPEGHGDRRAQRHIETRGQKIMGVDAQTGTKT